jgi:hypothetical protein
MPLSAVLACMHSGITLYCIALMLELSMHGESVVCGYSFL